MRVRTSAAVSFGIFERKFDTSVTRIMRVCTSALLQRKSKQDPWFRKERYLDFWKGHRTKGCLAGNSRPWRRQWLLSGALEASGCGDIPRRSEKRRTKVRIRTVACNAFELLQRNFERLFEEKRRGGFRREDSVTNYRFSKE